MDKLTSGNIKRVCRLCLKRSSRMIDLSDGAEDGFKKSLIDRIDHLFKIKITKEDGLSTNICNECQSKVNLFTDFFALVSESNRQTAHFVFPEKVTKSKKRAYQCYLCKKPMSRNNVMHRHFRNQHVDLLKYSCICTEVFKTNYGLTRHKKNCLVLAIASSRNEAASRPDDR